ncbi:helix-turn-helix domain-containing protein [Deinococcus radiophilus]
MPQIPSWYDVVAEQFSQANGRRAYKVTPLVPHLTSAEIAAYRDAAPTEIEGRRWTVIWHYTQQPQKLPVARKLGLSWQFVHNTVTKYNARGPESLMDVRRGRELRSKRLLNAEQEQELRALIDSSPKRLSNEQLADWFEAQIGKRPDATTLWMYRRGGSHSHKGRRAD